MCFYVFEHEQLKQAWIVSTHVVCSLDIVVPGKLVPEVGVSKFGVFLMQIRGDAGSEQDAFSTSVTRSALGDLQVHCPKSSRYDFECTWQISRKPNPQMSDVLFAPS